MAPGNRWPSTPARLPHSRPTLWCVVSPEQLRHEAGETGRRKSFHESESISATLVGMGHKVNLGQVMERQRNFYLFHIWVFRLSLHLMYNKGPSSYLEAF